MTLEHSATLKQECDLALCSVSSLKRSDPGDVRSTGQGLDERSGKGSAWSLSKERH